MIETYLNTLLEAETVEDVWQLHTEKMAGYGFDRLIYGYTRFRVGANLGDLQDAVVLTNHDPEYVDYFIGEKMYFKGPMVAWAAENTGACSWRVLTEKAKAGELTDSDMEALEINARLNVVAGYTISFNEVSARARAAIGLTAEPGKTQDDVDEIWKQSGPQIELANKVMHMKVTQLPHTTGQRRNLTARQREALEWVADGKTIQDAALIMGLNPATVEKHLRLARETLDVETTAQAVLKASSQNQFFLINR